MLSTCLEASGSVDVRASGEVARLEVRQAGAADVHLSDLAAVDVDHSSAGSGDAWINASRLLRTSIAGSSDVHISGGATVQETILGTGEVHRTLESADG